MKIEEKELYNSLPKEVKILLKYINRYTKDSEFILNSSFFITYEYQNKKIVKALYRDYILEDSNEIVWYYDYKGFHIYVNGFKFNYSLSNKIGFYFEEDTDYKEILKFNIIDDYVVGQKILDINYYNREIIEGYMI